MREKADFLISMLDLCLAQGDRPLEALEHAVEGYAHVYHNNDGRLPIARAAELALKRSDDGETS